MMEDPETEGSGFYLFGRDLMAIPCLRESALVGFAASFGVGIIHFLFTSRGRKSIQFAQLAFVAVTFPYVFYCQEKYYEKHLMILDVQAAIAEKEDDKYVLTDSLEFSNETWG